MVLRISGMVLVLAAGLGSGCDDLSDFATVRGMTKYAGCIVGDLPTATFIRNGQFAAHTPMELQFNPADAAKRPPDSDNTITTLETDDMTMRLFNETPLVPIAALSHDALSGYDFPGAGRVRNYIFIARPESGPLANRDTMVFVSLMESEAVEVRILGGRVMTPEEGDVEEQFGFFRLTRQAAEMPTNCGRPP